MKIDYEIKERNYNSKDADWIANESSWALLRSSILIADIVLDGFGDEPIYLHHVPLLEFIEKLHAIFLHACLIRIETGYEECCDSQMYIRVKLIGDQVELWIDHPPSGKNYYKLTPLLDLANSLSLLTEKVVIDARESIPFLLENRHALLHQIPLLLYLIKDL